MAANGNRTVAMQISTIPSWMLMDGLDPDSLPTDPWQYSTFAGYNKGSRLVDESCVELATYIARQVSWYTQGEMIDACGQRRVSGFRYKWAALSILNNDPPVNTEDNLNQYLTCYDAITAAVHKVYPALKTMGPEQWTRFPDNKNYTAHFLNGSNHADGQPPQLLSVHHVSHQDDSYEEWFTALDEWMVSTGRPLEQMRQQLAPETGVLFNEWSAGVVDWCSDPHTDEHGQASCDWVPRPTGQPAWRPINRQTISWNAAAAWWAYAYTQLATLPGAVAVGQDQLVAGPYPDNVPFVACLSWEPDGSRNAKYWVIHMLAHTLGSDERTIQRVTNAQSDDVFVGAYTRKSTNQRVLLLVVKKKLTVNVALAEAGARAGLQATVIGADLGGFATPAKRALVGDRASLVLGPFSVATVVL